MGVVIGMKNRLWRSVMNACSKFPLIYGTDWNGSLWTNFFNHTNQTGKTFSKIYSDCSRKFSFFLIIWLMSYRKLKSINLSYGASSCNDIPFNYLGNRFRNGLPVWYNPQKWFYNCNKRWIFKWSCVELWTCISINFILGHCSFCDPTQYPTTFF